MPLLRRFAAERDSDHPPPVQGRRCEVRLPRLIDPLHPRKRVRIERFTTQARRLVADANSLQRHRSHTFPPRRRIPPRCPPLCVPNAPPQPLLQPADTLLANQEPKLQRPEPPP